MNIIELERSGDIFKFIDKRTTKNYVKSGGKRINRNVNKLGK